MKSNEAYKLYEIKINKNDTNRNIKVNEAIFVKIYNEQAKIWLENEIKENESNYRKNDIAELLELDVPLVKNKINKDSISFALPTNYFDYASSYSVAVKGKCKDRILVNWDFKIKDRNSIITNNNLSPSFEYEETLINISKGNLIVFKSDFDISEQYLTYYSIPREIDIEGYIKEDGSYSTNVDPNLGDNYVNKIINLSVLETIRIFENPDGFQLAKDRVINK